VTHARDIWWTLDSANAFVSPGVNSRGELVPSHGTSRRRLGDYSETTINLIKITDEMCSSHNNRELTIRTIATPRYWKQKQMWTEFDRKFAKIYSENTETFSIKYTKFEMEKPSKQRTKVVLKILDLNTWRYEAFELWNERCCTCHTWCDEFQRCCLLNSNVSIRNLFVQLNQRLNSCKLTSKSKGIVQWIFTMRVYL
jgi:hypothetical protein